MKLSTLIKIRITCQLSDITTDSAKYVVEQVYYLASRTCSVILASNASRLSAVMLGVRSTDLL
jgi:hypothetical protein